MKRSVLFCLAFAIAVVAAPAQTTILDFEAPATSTVFQYFGSGLDGTFNDVTLKIVLTVTGGTGPYYLDNIRFV